jgi:hypothetical protein
MTTIAIEGIKDIKVEISKYEVRIDFEQQNGTTRLELNVTNAAYLVEKLQEKIK